MSNAVLHEFKAKARLMGSAFEFILCTDEADGHTKMDEAIGEVQRIEKLLTEFSPDSQTSLINRHAGIKPVPVDEEVYTLIKRSKNISALTQGAFDITAGVLRSLYNFKRVQFQMPEVHVIRQMLDKVGHQKISLLANNHVFLEKPGMHIGFGAIGKGYAADRVKKILLQKDISSGVINASGDLTAWGTRPDGTPWKVGIADPRDPSRTIAWIPVHNGSVATSGNYEQYFEFHGERYAHAIDPKSGKPVKGIKSVTVVAPGAELADALATAAMIMGPEVGLHFIDQLPHTHCLMVTDANKILTSKHMKVNLAWS